MGRELILASASRWRLQMLKDAGVRARGIASFVDEDLTVNPDPVALARDLALAKATAVASEHPDAWVLGADQVACDDQHRNRIWGKPSDPEDHFSRLWAMRGRAHVLVTGWALVGPGWVHRAHAETRLWVRGDLEEDEVRRYVATGEGSGCAAGYMAEGMGSFLFERIDGDWYNVLGLPLLDVMSVLRSQGWRFGEG